VTKWIVPSFTFKPLRKRDVVADFDGGYITSDALLLREVDAKFGFLDACFTDHRDAERIVRPLVDLHKQRVFGLSLCCENLNDHDRPRSNMNNRIKVQIGKRGRCAHAAKRRL
jgi:hypothetical protein